MKDRKLAKILLLRIVNENLSIYRKLFTETPVGEAKDPYWQAALSLFEKLDSNDKEVFFSILRQVSIDTVSTVTGVIDGSTNIGLEDEISLVSEDGTVLSGNLQDFFLEAVSASLVG